MDAKARRETRARDLRNSLKPQSEGFVRDPGVEEELELDRIGGGEEPGGTQEGEVDDGGLAGEEVQR